MRIKKRQQERRFSNSLSTLIWRSSGLSNRRGSKINIIRAFSLAGLFFTFTIVLQHSKLRNFATSPQQQHQQQQQQQQQQRDVTGSSVILSYPSSIKTDPKIPADLLLMDGLIAPRAFPFPNLTSFPCFPSSHEKLMSQLHVPSKRGFLFLKPYKTASSTAAGIHLRISKHVAQRQFQVETQRYKSDKNDVPPSSALFCEARFDHGHAHHLFPKRNKNQSFLWSIVREPQSRLTSLFYHFWVSRYGHQATTENFIDFARKDFWQSQEHYLKVLSTQEPFPKYVARQLRVAKAGGRQHEGRNATMTPTTTMNSNKAEYVNQILLDYDFLAITERLDESAVVLAMLLDLPLGDVLYLSAKGQGGYDDGGFHNQCTRIQKTVVTPGMRDFFSSQEWSDIVYWDDVRVSIRPLMKHWDDGDLSNSCKPIAMYWAAHIPGV
jgi:hypothetical protein